MNEFQEHTWSAAQRILDGQLAQRFEGLESAFAVAPETFPTEQAAALNAFAAEVTGIEHEGRRAHWHAELARIGWVAPPTRGTIDPPVIVDDPVQPEPVVEVAPEPEPRRGGKRHDRA